MLKMTQVEMQDIVNQRLLDDEDRRLQGLSMNCVRHYGRWSLVMTVDNSISIIMKSQRESVRTFANLDSAHKVATSIIRHMHVIGQ